jgi:enoyl-CoA hydratase/carnithine racemase
VHSMAEDRVRLEITDGVATATLSRPEKHNALDVPMFEALGSTAEQLRDEDEARVVVLHGEGPSFCSGLDFPSVSAGGEEAQQIMIGGPRDEHGAVLAQRVAIAWLYLPIPVIAVLQGHVIGGGFQIALGADIRFAAPDTRMCVKEIVYGLIPDMGSSVSFPLVMRGDVAKELTLTGRTVEADEALELGLVTRIAEDPLAEARDLAATIAERSPDAVRSAKELLNRAYGTEPGPELLELETELQRSLLARAMAAAQA